MVPPVVCGWLFNSSYGINRATISQQLTNLIQTATKRATPISCSWEPVPIRGEGYKSTTARAILVKTHPQHKTSVQHLLQNLITPDNYNNRTQSGYPFQRSMAFISSDYLGITESELARYRAQQEHFRLSEVTVRIHGLAPLHTPLTDSNHSTTLGYALLSFPDPTG